MKPDGRSSSVSTAPDKSGSGVGEGIGVSLGVDLGVGVRVSVGVGVGVAVGASAVCVAKMTAATVVAWASSSAYDGPHAVTMATNRHSARISGDVFFMAGYLLPHAQRQQANRRAQRGRCDGAV